MSSVQPGAMYGAVFCVVYNFVMFVVNAIGDHIVETYSSPATDFVCWEQCFFVFAPLGQRDDFFLDVCACLK